MARDLCVDQDPGALAEPRFEHGRDRPPIRRREADNKLVGVVAAFPGHRRTAAAGSRGHDPKEMQLAAEADRGSVAQAPSRRELRALLSVALEMAANPAFAFVEESVDLRLRPSPATTRCRWNRDDQAMIGVDRHSKATSPG